MGHNVGDKAAMAVEQGTKRGVKGVERTPEQRMANIRNLLASKLAVTPDEQRYLLSQYDDQIAIARAAASVVTEQVAEIARLNEQIEQFRAVYDQENSSTVVKVERVLLEPLFAPATPMSVGDNFGTLDGGLATVVDAGTEQA